MLQSPANFCRGLLHFYCTDIATASAIPAALARRWSVSRAARCSATSRAGNTSAYGYRPGDRRRGAQVGGHHAERFLRREHIDGRVQLADAGRSCKCRAAAQERYGCQGTIVALLETDRRNRTGGSIALTRKGHFVRLIRAPSPGRPAPARWWIRPGNSSATAVPTRMSPSARRLGNVQAPFLLRLGRICAGRFSLSNPDLSALGGLSHFDSGVQQCGWPIGGLPPLAESPAKKRLQGGLVKFRGTG